MSSASITSLSRRRRGGGADEETTSEGRSPTGQSRSSGGDSGDNTSGSAGNEGSQKGGKLPLTGSEDANEEESEKGLERTLSLGSGVAMIVGCIIGSGIWVSPTGVQAGAGSVGSSLIVWLASGLWCGIGAYLYAELGAMITKSGGEYIYLMEAFGPFIAFLRLWVESMVISSHLSVIPKPQNTGLLYSLSLTLDTALMFLSDLTVVNIATYYSLMCSELLFDCVARLTMLCL